ncbi:MAG: YdeI/OmpD-associated family protein [Candidatus Kerfeldbacteria bacterium]|nr:YdeI/OmpD-associated family protein [Candidatus Kerfeldbacteria bacterium]
MPKTRHSLGFKIKVPPDFAKALRTRPLTLRAFQSMPPSHQRRYVEYIYEAKLEKTRRQRIAKSLSMIVAGERKRVTGWS